MKKAPFVVVDQAVLGYCEKVVLSASFYLEKGKRFVILGPSGCGKTTLLYALAGLNMPVKGKIFIEGEEARPGRSKTGIVLQDFGLLPWKKVEGNLLLALSKKEEKKITNVLSDFHAENLKDFYPHQLSGGQKQRIALARSLLKECDFLLFDEAFSSLDSLSKEHLYSHVLKLQQEKEFTAVFVTHDIEEAVFLGEKILIFSGFPSVLIETIENPLSGKSEIKNQYSFYEMCQKLKQKVLTNASSINKMFY